MDILEKAKREVSSYKGIFLSKRDTLANSINSNLKLFFFDLILMLLVLLHNAGYFAPYFPITINVIIFIGLLLAIFLFKISSKIVFSISLLFLVFSIVLKLLTVEIWAERTVIYTYQSLILGSILMIYEIVSKNWSREG